MTPTLLLRTAKEPRSRRLISSPAGKAEEPGKVGQHAGRDEHRRRDEDQHAVDDRFSGPPAGVEVRPQACQRADALLPGQRRADDPRAHDEPDRADGAHALADLDEQGQLDYRYGDEEDEEVSHGRFDEFPLSNRRHSRLNRRAVPRLNAGRRAMPRRSATAPAPCQDRRSPRPRCTSAPPSRSPAGPRTASG